MNLERIKRDVSQHGWTDAYGLNKDEIEWIIEQAEKVKLLEEALDYVLTAEPEHYNDIKNMLEDFTYVINRTLEGK